jgi:hypothetical protein
MAQYTGIQGQNILIVSSDPANPVEGQIWYNSTTNLLKGYTALNAGWASGGNLNTGRILSKAVGTVSATLTTGGYLGGPPAVDTSTAAESYNGSSWTTVGSMNTKRYSHGASGTQTAAIAYTGVNPPTVTATESYNGSSWTTTPATVNTGRYGFGMSGNGTQTATIFAGGTNTGTSALSDSESYNGSAWTTTPVLGTATMYGSGCGTQTAAIIAGGGPTHVSQTFTTTQLWNGSSWTTNPTGLNTGRGDLALFGTQTSALAAGAPAPAVESWNGSTWTTTTAMPALRNSGIGAGASGSSGILIGGSPPPAQNTTVVWTGPGSFGTRTITTS